MFLDFLYVALGSAIGGSCRYAVMLLTAKFTYMPVATLFVNIIGSFFIGLLATYFALKGNRINYHIPIFITIGILGGFTTFSSYIKDTIMLYSNYNLYIATTYVLANNIGGMLAAVLGMVLIKRYL